MRKTLVMEAAGRIRTAGDECVLWAGCVHKSGYGSAWSRGRCQLAHRVLYELAIGPIPPGMTLDHECFTPLCVNPRHLVPATRSTNSARQRSAVKSTCVNGHEFDTDNTYIRPRGNRNCRACNSNSVARYTAKRRKVA